MQECDVISIEKKTRPEKLNEVTAEASEAAIAVRKMFPNPPTGSAGMSSSNYGFEFNNQFLAWVIKKSYTVLQKKNHF